MDIDQTTLFAACRLGYPKGARVGCLGVRDVQLLAIWRIPLLFKMFPNKNKILQSIKLSDTGLAALV